MHKKITHLVVLESVRNIQVGVSEVTPIKDASFWPDERGRRTIGTCCPGPILLKGARTGPKIEETQNII